ncbi:hypothetical protein GCM10009847_18240 [Leucobacter tardus]|uniref:YdcF family protein n=1 Tax=Leucobacter tardus TaxID=501483 RepID=A0A939QG90_9MICO|nr:YdcF family protein [Leucobacter tardus]MBO2990663.1 YdcF family protein [Leucobacter tardus]
MQIAPALVIALIGTGGLFVAGGSFRFIRDARRIVAPVVALIGWGLLALGVGLWLVNLGSPLVLIIVLVAVFGVLLLGNLVGYPLLVLFLLYSGVTILRRESRTLGNALALIAGIALLVLPTTLGWLAPADVVRDDPAYLIRYAVHLSAVLVVVFFGFAFAAFIVASLLYRWRRGRAAPEAVIVLGAGLIDGRVPPLLAGRLDRGIQARNDHGGVPFMIASGGQGDDEPRPEGEAMREYLIAHGVPAEVVVAETRSRTTAENLRFSRELLSGPDARVVVATSSYHVFRAALLTRALGMRAHVVGARTAWYFLPSAVLREFAGVMRDHWRVNAVATGLLIAGAVAFTLVIVPAMVPVPG